MIVNWSENFYKGLSVTKREMRLSDFDISDARGFLPKADPVFALPAPLNFLDDFGKTLPELIETGLLLDKARSLPVPPLDYFKLLSKQELQLAWVRYVFIQSAFVHVQKRITPYICPNIARPVWAISKLLKKPPILSYDAYTLNNWKRIDINKGIKIDNLEIIQTFIRDPEQAWFILIHVDIENEAGWGISDMWDANLCIKDEHTNLLEYFIFRVNESIKKMIAVMKRMPEGTSPDTYHRIRPWIMPFDNVLYEGVEELGGKLQSFRGQTGAQTSIFQALEAGLQMPRLSENKLSMHLFDMRKYMPLKHRQFIEYLEDNARVREFIISSAPNLADLYDECVMNVLTFLAIHLGYAFFYIHQKTDNPKGTGGTDFMDYLGERIKERWERAFIKPRSEADFKLFMNNVRKIVKELITA